jgi:hypothetical protein
VPDLQLRPLCRDGSAGKQEAADALSNSLNSALDVSLCWIGEKPVPVSIPEVVEDKISSAALPVAGSKALSVQASGD